MEDEVNGPGGGIQRFYCASPTLISNNAIFGNTAAYGAGICCWGSGDEDTRLVNNTVSANAGDGMCFEGCFATVVANCIVTANAGPGIAVDYSTLTIRHNDVYG